MTLLIILLAVFCLAYANGANDNFKGVATLFGTGTTNYRGALTWATVTTFLGSLTAIFLAEQLLKSFSGKGLVDAHLTTDATYVAAVALGAGLTVLLATKIGMPISTTHSLVGGLVGAGWAAGAVLNFNTLAVKFFIPLLLSPVVAIVVTALCYPAFRLARRMFGVTEETCLCVGNEIVEVVPLANGTLAFDRAEQLTVSMGTPVTCQSRYRGKLLGIDAARTLDSLHYLSAGIVSFARGLNDTPKIAALLLVVPAMGGWTAIAVIGVLIAVGGIISARKVAETMSQKITTMNHGQGFTANLITGLVVLGASRYGMPVSTTHVSCGSLFGIGAVTGQAKWRTISRILAAWVTTLPLAAAVGALCYRTISLFG